jgi:hypothetical protein
MTLVSLDEVPALRALEKALKLQLIDPAQLEALANARQREAQPQHPQHHEAAQSLPVDAETL